MDPLFTLPSFVGICSKACSSPAIKHVAYPFTTTFNINSLKSATEELKAKKEDINDKIHDANRTDGVPTKEVELWLRQVEAIEKEATDIQQNYQQLCRCLCNISPNLWSNYKISRSAAKAQLEVKSLCDKSVTFEQVTVHRQVLAQEMPTSLSEAPMLKSALSDITNDAHTIIGITGMGGIGKTHLLKQINNKILKSHAFIVVVFVKCSKGCSEEKIQDAIIKSLSLTEGDSVEKKGSIILSFLKEKSFLILLDDLWDSVDLITIGIPVRMSEEDAVKGKIVLTTRSTAVCGAMGVTNIIRVDHLKWDQSWSLFIKNVTERTVMSDPFIQQYAEDMVKELGGLPLALIAIGKTMSNKTDPRQWELALKRLQEGLPPEVTLSGIDESVYRRLMLSYDYLPNATLQQCFLHCSLWPEDYHIKKNDLIELWMGLGLIDELDDIHTAYITGYSYIGSLQAVGLLETHNGYNVIMHDVIRDMALWIARNQGAQMKKWIVPPGSRIFQEIHVSPDTEKLSLLNTEVQKVFFSPTECSPNLSLLITHLCDSNALPLVLFSKLTVLDLSDSNFEAFPAKICHQLVYLQYLNLSWNTKLKSLPQELGALSKLKYLFLRGIPQCTIPAEVLPKLHALRLVDLTCSYDFIPANLSRTFEFLEKELRCLSHFQALGITIVNRFDFQKLSTSTVPVRWLKLEKLPPQLGYFSFLSTFVGNSRLLNNLLILELNNVKARFINFERSKDQSICRLERLEELTFECMDYMEQIVWMGLDPKDVFLKLQVLNFIGCVMLRSISWVACLPWIRELTVRRCFRIKKLISIDELNDAGLVACQPSFRCLKKMSLSCNDVLECISDPTVTFPALQVLTVMSCPRLKKLPFKTDESSKKIFVNCSKEWWKKIEMDDITRRTLFKTFFY